VIEQIHDEAIGSVNKRPKTAKPTETNVQGLKKMVEEINGQIGEHRTVIDQLNGEIEEFYSKNKV
jgi:peptidoglycan hydrolase CwlO-like protein